MHQRGTFATSNLGSRDERCTEVCAKKRMDFQDVRIGWWEGADDQSQGIRGWRVANNYGESNGLVMIMRPFISI